MNITLWLVLCLLAAGPMAYAQEAVSDETVEAEQQEASLSEETDGKSMDDIFDDRDTGYNEEWSIWFKEAFKPYDDALTAAVLKIFAAAGQVDTSGKRSEQIIEEVTEAYNRALRNLEMVKPPVELKSYHKTIVELYKLMINADPELDEETKLKRQSLTAQAEKEMIEALRKHGVPENIINRINQNR